MKRLISRLFSTLAIFGAALNARLYRVKLRVDEFLTRSRHLGEMFWATVLILVVVALFGLASILTFQAICSMPMPPTHEVGATLYETAHNQAVAYYEPVRYSKQEMRDSARVLELSSPKK